MKKGDKITIPYILLFSRKFFTPSSTSVIVFSQIIAVLNHKIIEITVRGSYNHCSEPPVRDVPFQRSLSPWVNLKLLFYEITADVSIIISSTYVRSTRSMHDRYSSWCVDTEQWIHVCNLQVIIMRNTQLHRPYHVPLDLDRFGIDRLYLYVRTR